MLAKSEENTGRRKRAIKRTLIIGGAFVLGFIIFGVVAIQVWEYSNSVAFCADACHDVHPEEIHAFEDSFHANVKCTECHMGRVGTLSSIVQKAGHFQHLPEVVFDQYGRPLESETMRPANESCEKCHWPAAFHGDTVREVRRFLPDEENTEQRTYLLLKTGAANREASEGYGIHWHITNPVEYIATDEHKQDIRWIRTTLPDGRTVEYNDAVDPLTAEEITQAEPVTMDCVDCHNRMGHPFPSPGDLIHDALGDGRLSADLPYVKAFMLSLLDADYATQEEALAAVESMKERYLASFPKAAAAHPEKLDQAQQVVEELVTQLYFKVPGVTWQSFPDNNRHTDFAGCFRCHDGNHLTDDGESIRLHCNICHSVPATVGAGDRPPSLPISSIQEPASHLASNFMADHRFQANEECEACHGEIQFGADDSSFCANSACHDRAWPMAELDAAFEHPIDLEGTHSEVWCHECHSGVRKPEFECANCHKPPSEPHFGPVCEDCHTPDGFEGADWGDFEHPMPLEGTHATLECQDCHVAGAELSPNCGACHTPPNVDHFGPACEDCHTPAGFQGARLPAEAHPVPLEGAHQAAACDGCHTADQEKPPTVCSECHEPPAGHLTGECEMCHSPEGFARSASFLVQLAPQIPHELTGREDCLLCHDPAGQIRPAPSNHVDHSNEQCSLCHKATP
ncbi:hypothetical protein ACFLWA_02120 [Chloroflexota bacterium]